MGYFVFISKCHLQQERMDSSKVCIVLVCLMALNTLSFALNRPVDFVNAHNTARKEVGVVPLVWNNTLAAYAQKYANKRSADCAMQHSEGPYGENIAAGSWDLSAKEAVDMWLEEKKFYNPKSIVTENDKACITHRLFGLTQSGLAALGLNAEMDGHLLHAIMILQAITSANVLIRLIQYD